jgi:DNA-binding Lrp family transcriptional regulator
MQKSGTAKSGKLTATSREILKELLSNPSGLRASTISKLVNKPNRTTYNALTKLQKTGIVENIAPIWKLCQFKGIPLNMAKLLKSGNIELHDFSFVIRLIDKPDWWEKRYNHLIKLKEHDIKPITWGRNPYQQIVKDSFLIQLFSNSMIFISNKRYYGEDPFDCLIQAIRDFLDCYTFVEQRWRFKFFKDGIPQASIRSQHHVKLGDYLAKRCKKTGDKFEVFIDGKLRMWVDMSEPLGTEAGHKDYAPEDMRVYSSYIGDVIKNNPPKASEQSERLSSLILVTERITQNQAVFDANMMSHIKAVQDLGKAVTELRKEIKKRKPKEEHFDRRPDYIN